MAAMSRAGRHSLGRLRRGHLLGMALLGLLRSLLKLSLKRFGLGLLEQCEQPISKCADHRCFPMTSRVAWVRSPRRLKSPRTSPGFRPTLSFPTSM